MSEVWTADREQRLTNERSGDTRRGVAAETPVSLLRPLSSGLFPLDEQQPVWDALWSEGVARLVVWLSGQVTFGEASEILAEVGQIHVSSSTVWRQTQRFSRTISIA